MDIVIVGWKYLDHVSTINCEHNVEHELILKCLSSFYNCVFLIGNLITNLFPKFDANHLHWKLWFIFYPWKVFWPKLHRKVDERQIEIIKSTLALESLNNKIIGLAVKWSFRWLIAWLIDAIRFSHCHWPDAIRFDCKFLCKPFWMKILKRFKIKTFSPFGWRSSDVCFFCTCSQQSRV